jgi:5-deoxy-glucuronate isomerase
MLTETLFRLPRKPGIHILQQRGDRGARELTTRRMQIPPGTTATLQVPGEESVLVVQRGAATLRAGRQTWDASRADVFRDRASAVYLPPGVQLEITAIAEGAGSGGSKDPAHVRDFEAVVFSAPAPDGGEAVFVGPGEVQVMARGRANYSREVHNIFVDDPHVRRLMVGEPFNPPGNWSSFPPHKHDGRDGEPTLEEVYYFRIDPPQGFGQQMLYTADGECVTHAVKDGDTVLLPYGYHPVSAPPGYRLYYLWGMAGEQRKLALHEDPAHKWIHDAP